VMWDTNIGCFLVHRVCLELIDYNVYFINGLVPLGECVDIVAIWRGDLGTLIRVHCMRVPTEPIRNLVISKLY
jgi:hypothetical protein